MAATHMTGALTLSDHVFEGLVPRYRAALLVVAGALFVAVAAQVSLTPPQWYANAFSSVGLPIEGTPVPITLQTLAVGLTGAALGSRLGTMSLLLYLFAGIAGLPVYAGSVGDILSGEVAFGATDGSLWGGATSFWAMPSFGYIIGFVIAATLIGRLAERGWDRSFLYTALAMLAGSLVIYAFGLPWLHMSFDNMTISLTLDWGLWPFVPGDILKLLVAAGALPGAWVLLRREPKLKESEDQL